MEVKSPINKRLGASKSPSQGSASSLGQKRADRVVRMVSKEMSGWSAMQTRAEIREHVATDKEFVHPVGIGGIAAIKTEYKQLCAEKVWNDKLFCWCFCLPENSMVGRTVEFLTDHLDWRRKNDRMAPTPFAVLPQNYRSNHTLCFYRGLRDVQGRGLCYVFMNNFTPSEYSAKEQIDLFLMAV